MSLPPVTFSGMLKKTGGWLTESKQDRYFEIRGPVLYYHETKPQSADAKPKGEIALTHTSLSNNPIDPLEFFIAGDHLKKTFKLTAASEDEVAMWMWKLRLANPNVADSFHSDARMLAHVTRQQLNGVRKDIGKNANVNTTVDKVISQFLGKTVPQPDKLISQLQAAGAENDVAEALEAMAGLNDTALHIAAMGGCAPVAEVLLQSGASAAATNNEGLTPLHYAAEFDKVDVAKLLIGQNAPLDVKDCKGFSPLNTAAHQGSMEVLNLLLAHKAPLDSPTVDGATPLMSAAQNGKLDAVNALLAAGASVSAVHSTGQTVLHLGHSQQKTAACSRPSSPNPPMLKPKLPRRRRRCTSLP